jgi:hypothetical protein
MLEIAANHEEIREKCEENTWWFLLGVSVVRRLWRAVVWLNIVLFQCAVSIALNQTTQQRPAKIVFSPRGQARNETPNRFLN